jgi:hypothetical protein
MPSQPFPTNIPLEIEMDKLEPQVPVLECNPAPIAPTLALPSKDEAAHSMNQEFGVRVQLDS